MVWACERAGVDLDRIEDIAAGCVNPAHEGMGDIARWAALAAGFDAASGEIVVTMDADLQDDPAEIPRLIEKLDEGFDLVAGWKRDRKDSWSRRRSVTSDRFSNTKRRTSTGPPTRSPAPSSGRSCAARHSPATSPGTSSISG